MIINKGKPERSFPRNLAGEEEKPHLHLWIIMDFERLW
jgi:hypothetical protein